MRSFLGLTAEVSWFFLVSAALLASCADSEGNDHVGDDGSAGSDGAKMDATVDARGDANGHAHGSRDAAGGSYGHDAGAGSGGRGGADAAGGPGGADAAGGPGDADAGAGSGGRGADGRDWVAPLGIPEPEFGIRELAPEPPSNWTAPVDGAFYVDNQHPQATDTDNPQGTADRPRATVPRDLDAGSTVFVGGGPYGQTGLHIAANGTVDSPVFVTAADPNSRPVITPHAALEGSYLIVEYFDFAGPDSGVSVRTPSDHIVVRHSEVRNGEGGGSGLYTGRWNPEDDPATAEHVVFWNNHVHDNGDVMATFDEDHHAVAVGHHANHVWILDNEMARNSGDGLQVNAKKAYLTDTLHHVYAGRNESHDNKQTGLWTKQAADVVFSQNVVYGHRPSNSSGGAGIGFQYGPERVWILFNEVYDCEMGVTSSTNVGDEDGVAGTGQNIYLIGNLIYDIHKESGEPPGTDPWQAGAGVHFTDQDATKHVYFNTIHDTDVAFTYARGSGPVHLANNLLTGSVGTHVRIETAAAATGSTIHHVGFDAAAAIRWGDNTDRSLSEFQQASSGQCSGCLTGDPSYENPPADFRVAADSLAVDAGIPIEALATFEMLYDLSIAFDLDRQPRHQGANVDMGAFER